MDRRISGGLRQAALVAALVLLAGLTVGLAEAFAASPSPAPSTNGLALHIGWTTEPDNLNPFIGWQNQDYEIWSINYDFLFGFGTTSQPTLDLASEFPTRANGGLAADGKVWTIHMRPGVRWSDGKPLTAADVAFTYNYIVKNKMLNMALSTAGILEATALNPTTVRITCSSPKADMEKVFVPILPEHIWKKVSPQAATTSFTNPAPIVGSGPFYVAKWVKGSYIQMDRNPYYWGKRPTLDAIYFETYENPDTMTTDLKSGALDAAWGIPVAQFKSLTTVPGLTALAYHFYNWDYLNFNCYAGTSSLGNPVLRDWRFRNALNYAIDRQRLCALAFVGYASPGTTILPPNTWVDPDYHWQPSASQLYTFNLAKASQLLTAAGYPLRNGVRLDKQGKPIVLRLWATTDSEPEQIEGKLITGWLQALGIKIDFGVIDSGALTARIWNYQGKTYAPDFDMYVDNWLGYFDPGETLMAETTGQIGGTNEPSWSDPQYDMLCAQQFAALNPTARQALIWRMQQVMYQQTPWIVLTYPDYFEAYNTAKWTGWTRVDNGTGPAFYTTGNVDSYVNLKPVVTTATGGGKSTLWILIGVVAAAAVVVVVMTSRRRAQSRTVEE
jgi:peptide/nickel transport system substrate-binding protein